MNACLGSFGIFAMIAASEDKHVDTTVDAARVDVCATNTNKDRLEAL